MRTLVALALLAAILGARGGDRARADGGTEAGGHDELAKGEWAGDKDWSQASGGEGALVPVPPPVGAPGPVPGTPTPDDEPDGSVGTPPGTTSGGSADGEPGMDTGPAPAPPGAETDGDDPFRPADGAGSCPAHWVLEEQPCDAELVSEQTMLTLVLFSNDTFAYICNAYARAESTWYVDWLATTTARHDGTKGFGLTLRLEGECPDCAPTIDLSGSSLTDAQAKVQAWWGNIDSGCTAQANAQSTWTGPIDCGTSSSVTIRQAASGEEVEIGTGGVKLKFTGGKSSVYDTCPGSKSDHVTLRGGRTSLRMTDRATVAVYAAGSECNSQAKARVGNLLGATCVSRCGAYGRYELRLVER